MAIGLVVGKNLAYIPGNGVLVIGSAYPANRFEATVSSYVAATGALTLTNPVNILGSFTQGNDFYNVSLNGIDGATGLTGATGAPGVGYYPGNYVAQGYLANATQTIPYQSDTIINFVTLAGYDPQGWINPSTNAFKPTIPGYYLISFSVWFSIAASGSVGQINIQINKNETGTDPLLDRSISSIPKRWGIEYLDENNIWNTAIEFNEDSTRTDGSPIFPWDGYLELYYGFRIPDKYKESFHFIDYLSSDILLPSSSYEGDSYIVGASSASVGTVYTWNSDEQKWDSNNLEYGFYLSEDNDTKRIGIIESLVNPRYYNDPQTGRKIYRDVSMIKGIRVFVKTMTGPQTTFVS